VPSLKRRVQPDPKSREEQLQQRTYRRQALVFVVRVPADAHHHRPNLGVLLLERGCRRRMTGKGGRDAMLGRGVDASEAVIDASERE
jgi:hypothetical protein